MFAYNENEANSVSCPGETILETLKANFAIRLKRSPAFVDRLIVGTEPITGELATQMQDVLGVPAFFWNARERRYREWVEKRGKP